MSKTLDDLRTKTRYWLDDPGGNTWTNAKIDPLINDGQRFLLAEMLRVNPDYMLSRATGSTVAGTEAYPTPSTMYQNKFRGLWLYNGSASMRYKINYKSPDTVMGMQHEQGIPSYYTMVRDAFILAPVPDGSYTLEMWYTLAPTELSADSDVTVFNDEETNVISLWAAITGMTPKSGDTSRLEKILTSLLDQMKAGLSTDDGLVVDYDPLDMT